MTADIKINLGHGVECGSWACWDHLVPVLGDGWVRREHGKKKLTPRGAVLMRTPA